jgi:DNA polymerase-1
MNRLIILDSNALLHRAYHAMPPLTSPTGEPTGAVYGFISMLLRLKNDLAATYFAATFDRPTPTFRNELYKEYQSQRPPLDEDLIKQIGTVHEVLHAMSLHSYEQDGYEADDIIASIVSVIQKKETKHNKKIIDQIIVVTGDRDILQLVKDEQVLVYMPVKGLSEAKLYGEQDVFERLGVYPNQIPDWKALCGDPSDNYPGVAGIGPKTASDLVTKYGTIEEIYTLLEQQTTDIKERTKEKLLLGKKDAFLSKNLATIRDTADIDIEPESLYIPSFYTEETIKMFQHLGFPSLIKRMSNNEQPKKVIEQQKSESKDNQLDLFT